MEFDLRALGSQERYKLLTSVVVPRPIALVTTLDEAGRVNAAPFSFFNLLGTDPPVIALGIGNGPSGEPKDTARNIQTSGEFVVSVVTEELVDAMNVAAVPFPPGEDELAAAGLATAPSLAIRAPRIAASPVSLECRLAQVVTVGNNRIVLGEVVHLHIADPFVDPARLYVRTDALRMVGRMHGGGGYARLTDLFVLPRMSYEEWRARDGERGGT